MNFQWSDVKLLAVLLAVLLGACQGQRLCVELQPAEEPLLEELLPDRSGL